jgi:hypothetical protein
MKANTVGIRPGRASGGTVISIILVLKNQGHFQGPFSPSLSKALFYNKFVCAAPGDLAV